jgi:septum formation protein
MMEIAFQTVKIDFNEHYPAYLKANEIAEYLSEKKSLSYPDKLKADELLITADTIVWCENEMLGKPMDENDALRMLSKLSGKMHTVYTGVCLRTENKKRTFSEKTDVYFNELDKNLMAHYVQKYKPFDKAGSYGVQEWIGVVGIRKIAGCFYNVMGLPTSRLYNELKEFLS